MNVLLEWVFSIDFAAIEWVCQIGGNLTADAITVFFSYIGTYRLAALFLTLLLGLKEKTRPIAFILFLSVLISYGITGILKEIIERPRPYVELGLMAADMLVLTDPYLSFPSGHTTTAFATATVVFVYFKRWRIIAIISAAIAGLARIYLMVHYPSDVLAGALIGTGTALCIIYLYGRYKKSNRSANLKDKRNENKKNQTQIKMKNQSKNTSYSNTSPLPPIKQRRTQTAKHTALLKKNVKKRFLFLLIK